MDIFEIGSSYNIKKNTFAINICFHQGGHEYFIRNQRRV